MNQHGFTSDFKQLLEYYNNSRKNCQTTVIKLLARQQVTSKCLLETQGLRKTEYGGTRTPDLMVRSHKL